MIPNGDVVECSPEDDNECDDENGGAEKIKNPSVWRRIFHHARAVREMREETGLDVELLGVLGVYSRPDRDPRRHTMSVVFVGRPRDAAALKAGDDAARAAFYPLDRLPQPICFDHARILADFGRWLAGERTLAPVEPAGEDD